MTKGGLRMRVGKLGTWLICAGAMAAFGSLAGNYVWTSRWPSTLDAAPTESVKIAAVAYIGSCPILMAKENGYLASEGIAAEVNFQANGKVALAEALQGRADLATAADTPIMFAAMNDQPVSVIAAMTAMEDHAIVGRKDRGIISPSSLKGKRLGVTMGTTTQFFLDAFLNRQQFTPTDITLVDMLPQKLAETLARGDIDAVVLYQPFLNMAAAALKDKATVLSGEGVYDALFALAGTRDYVSAHQPTLEKVLRATIRGAQFCKESPDLAREVLAKAMNTDAVVLKAIWPSYRFEVGLRQGLLLTLEDEARWAIKNRLTDKTKVPNYLDHLGLAPLRAAAPSAVTVIH
ncbi:ABC transporter substrate-binding protein [Bradyrhizobium sp.]|jgi:NitT/TauT family transport system substrate-binding protein|uniref:ABC transporter substrate-binding protein n=1 Tax=Bradyrhizobium sp. TaxID=376 RepID=UPI003C1BEA1E